MSLLAEQQRSDTVGSIARAQTPDGTIPWVAGGNWDPWDHIECVLALDAGGLHDNARAGLRHLARTQRHDGAWACPIVGGDESTSVLDSNGASYIAFGTWHHFLCTRDTGALHELWPVVERAIEFTLDLQMPSGAIAWARNLDGDAGDHALLAGSSAIVMSLRAALQIVHTLGEERPDWELSLTSLVAAIERFDPDFADRSRYSMDWYYPVLSGVLTDEAARDRIEESWDTFVVDGLGARCVDDRPWITSAETAELTIALHVNGMQDRARTLFEWVQYQRDADGSYWTGATFPDGRHFPNERSTWSAAAIVLANDVLTERGPIAELFATVSARDSGHLADLP
ncbi:MAG: hypothetical protein QOG04_780 [Actinomycetota bacterium]|nr:hypothetical protein [Actinomycetota bacterium]